MTARTSWLNDWPKVGFKIETCVLKMLIIYGPVVVQKALCSVLQGIPMLFQLDNWMHGIQTRFLPSIRDGKLYGVVHADMKTALAAMVVASGRFVRQTS